MDTLNDEPLPIAGEERIRATGFDRVIFDQDFKNPDGTVATYYCLFRLKAGTVPAMILPVTKNGNVITVRQFRHGINGVVFEIPGGCRREGEATQTAEQVAINELEDETGYQVGKVISLGTFCPDPATLRVEIDLFLGLDCVKTGRLHHDAEERIEIVESPVGVWIAGCLRGEIKDAKSVVATMRALPHLRKHGVRLSY